jgi:hypothetical protein
MDKHGITEAELALLSDEERAAIEGEEDPQELEALREIAEGGGEEERRARLPLYEVKPVEKFEEQVKALDEQVSEAVAQFQAGDIELADLLTKQRDLATRRIDLRDQNLKAELAYEFNGQAIKTEWFGDVQSFFAHTKAAEGIDYTKPLLNAAFDTALKTLAADEKNKERSSIWFLRETHRVVQAELGAAADLADGGEHQHAEDGGGAGAPSDFEAIDRLEGEELEAALARMSPARQEQYLRR